jgi:hypothetical protein
MRPIAHFNPLARRTAAVCALGCAIGLMTAPDLAAHHRTYPGTATINFQRNADGSGTFSGTVYSKKDGCRGNRRFLKRRAVSGGFIRRFGGKTNADGTYSTTVPAAAFPFGTSAWSIEFLRKKLRVRNTAIHNHHCRAFTTSTLLIQNTIIHPAP